MKYFHKNVSKRPLKNLEELLFWDGEKIGKEFGSEYVKSHIPLREEVQDFGTGQGSKMKLIGYRGTSIRPDTNMPTRRSIWMRT